jgi:hypothetical protein
MTTALYRIVAAHQVLSELKFDEVCAVLELSETECWYFLVQLVKLDAFLVSLCGLEPHEVASITMEAYKIRQATYRKLRRFISELLTEHRGFRIVGGKNGLKHTINVGAVLIQDLGK